MASFRTKDNVTVSIDKAGNEFIGARCINPLKDSPMKIGNVLDVVNLTPLPEITGFVPYKIVKGEFIRL